LLETAAMANMNQYVAHFENALFRAVASAALPEMTL
jgi:hypothetical protein